MVLYLSIPGSYPRNKKNKIKRKPTWVLQQRTLAEVEKKMKKYKSAVTMHGDVQANKVAYFVVHEWAIPSYGLLVVKTKYKPIGAMKMLDGQ